MPLKPPLKRCCELLQQGVFVSSAIFRIATASSGDDASGLPMNNRLPALSTASACFRCSRASMLKIITASTIRNHPGALSPKVKSLNYLNNIMAKIEGTDAGTEEALMLNHNGEVAECTADNIFIVKRGVLKTPQPDCGLLEGITRGAVMRLAREADIEVRECVLVRHDIYTADECFLTGTGAEVIAVVSLDGRTIGSGKPGPITRNLLERFRRLTRGA